MFSYSGYNRIGFECAAEPQDGRRIRLERAFRSQKESMEILKKLWSRWKAFGRRLADLQARVILTLVYFIIVPIFGLFVRAFSDPLYLKPKSRDSMWLAKHLDEPSIENARRQA